MTIPNMDDIFTNHEKTRLGWIALLTVLAVALCGCAGFSTQPNSCLPEAVMMQNGLREKGVKAGVLRIQFEDDGHAITCYELTPSKGYAWDILWGSVPLNPWGWDAETTGLQWCERWMPAGKKFVSATWLTEVEK